MIDQDKAARSAGEGVGSGLVSRLASGRQVRRGEGNREKAREAGPPRREEGWAPEEGGQWALKGLQRGDSGY